MYDFHWFPCEPDTVEILSRKLRLEFDQHTRCSAVVIPWAQRLRLKVPQSPHTKVPCQVLRHHPRNFQVLERHSKSPVHDRCAACNSPLHLPTSSNIHIKSANLSDAAAFFRRPPGLGLASALAPWPAAPTRGAVSGVSGVSGVILSHSCHLKILWKVWWGEQHCTIGLIKLINEIPTAEPIWAYSIWAWSDLHNFHMEHFASFLPLKYESNHCSIMFNRLCTNQVWQNPTLSNLCHWSTSTLDVKPRKAKRQMDIDDKAVQREKHTCRVSNFAKLWCDT